MNKANVSGTKTEQVEVVRPLGVAEALKPVLTGLAEKINSALKEVGVENPSCVVWGSCMTTDKPNDVDLEVYGATADELIGALEKLRETGVLRDLKTKINQYVVAEATFGEPSRKVSFQIPRVFTENSGPPERYGDSGLTEKPNATPEEAARRRAFTFQAAGWNPVTGQIVGSGFAQSDFSSRTLRILNPWFGADPLDFFLLVRTAVDRQMTLAEGCSTKVQACLIDSPPNLSPSNCRQDRVAYERQLLFGSKRPPSEYIRLMLQLQLELTEPAMLAQFLGVENANRLLERCKCDRALLPKVLSQVDDNWRVYTQGGRQPPDLAVIAKIIAPLVVAVAEKDALTEDGRSGLIEEWVTRMVGPSKLGYEAKPAALQSHRASRIIFGGELDKAVTAELAGPHQAWSDSLQPPAAS